MVDTERKRRSRAGRGSNAVAAARGTANGRRNLIGLAVLAVIAVVVIGGVLYQRAQAAQELSAATQSLASVGADGTVVLGKDTATKSLDVYEDFLCPYCKHDFEDPYGTKITKAAADGRLKITYHVLELLDNESNPAGYSLRAANAALASVKAGKFAEFHASLYDSQPTEGQSGYTDDELITMARKVGITGDEFVNEVRAKTYGAKIRSQTDHTRDQTFFKGTPTVMSNGSPVDIRDPKWLDKLLSGGQPG